MTYPLENAPYDSEVLQPYDLPQAWEWKKAAGKAACYVAGGTYLRTQWEPGSLPKPACMIDLRNIAHLQELRATARDFSIGALTLLSFALSHQLLRAAFPALNEALASVAAPSIRNLGTVGGNICTGTGDLLPALLVYDARLIWHSGSQKREIPLETWLSERAQLAGADSCLDTDAILSEILIPCSGTKETSTAGRLDTSFSRFRKIGRREAFTPSLVTVALAGKHEGDGRICDVRIAVAGGSATPQRIRQAEDMLEGNVVSEVLLGRLFECVREQFTAYTDAFASENYRKIAAANIIASELWRLQHDRAAHQRGDAT